MRKIRSSILLLLLLFCASSCEDTPAQEDGTAAVTAADTYKIPGSEEEGSGTPESGVSWTPFL